MSLKQTKALSSALCSFAALVLSLACEAAEITSDQARLAVDNWLRRDVSHLQAKLGGLSLSTSTYKDATGVSLFHAVRLNGGGFVVTSADSGVEPVIAFSEADDLIANADNPLWALLNKDMSQRRAVLAAQRGRLAQAVSVPTEAEKAWAGLLDGRQTQPLGVASVSDLRVEPIVQSHWGQSTVSGFWGNYNCYNYYTPYGYPCGCVATAMAQIMRKHRFPTSSVPARTFSCFVNGASANLTMNGGVYSWDLMRLQPDEGGDTAPSETIRAEIGRLCYDAGVSVHMQYAADGSGAYSESVPGALVDVFGYASAYRCGGWWGASEEDICSALLSNLDHGFPVYLEIAGAPGNHAIVADGYGFDSGARYFHLNMGWNLNGNGGYQNAWYNVPRVDTTMGVFTALNDIIYNIFPDSEKMLVSGRVLDFAGAPATNVTVLVLDWYTGQICSTAKTNSKGIYTLSWSGAGLDWMYVGIFATNGPYASGEVWADVMPSSDWGGPGNVWGADLVLSEPVSYAVVLDANGGTGGSSSCIVRVGAEPPRRLAAPSRPGFEFLGYFDTPQEYSGAQCFDASMTPSGVWHDASVKVLYAQWKAVAVQVGDVFVPFSWLDQFRLAGVYSYESAAMRDQDGDAHPAWQEYVAGSNPTNRSDVLCTQIMVSNGWPLITWNPDLGAERVYTVLGKTNLSDAVWGPTNAGSRFYRVKVDLP